MKLIILFTLLSVASPAQVPAKEPVHETIFIDPEVMPEFKGGNQALMRYIQDSVKSRAFVTLEESYNLKPAYAKFSISESGKVGHVRIVRSSNVPRVDSLFKSAIEKMPDWIPGSIDGKPKSAEMNLPLRLELQ
jgi:protein TonB